VALRRPVTIPPLETLYPLVMRLLYDRLSACLSMAQKAGAAVSGATLLRQALAHNRIHCVVLADDIAASRAEEYCSHCTQRGIPWTILFSKAELGQLLGKPSRSAIGLSEPRFCHLLQTNVELLKQLRSSMEGSEARLGWSKQSLY
jgi:ribosomal protein L7Ae-like RNA K-turn-binding protein